MKTKFVNRQEAGQQLAQALHSYHQHPETIVIALPRGGVVVGAEVAQALQLPLDVICPRKIGAPFNPELAIGAITETGEGVFSTQLIHELGISESDIKQAVEKEKREALSRLKRYRTHRPPRDLKDKHVLLVDDGLATGSTMLAAIQTAKAEGAREVIVAIPVAPPDTLLRFEKLGVKIVCLASPSHFYAVSQFYDYFDQTTDEEVIELLEKVQNAIE